MSSYRPLRFLDASARADEIVANDKLGIGTHSQTSELHIKADAPEVRIQDEVSEVTETALRITANTGTVSFQSGTDFTEDSKGDFKFESMHGGTTHMTIDGSTGRVGVGTTQPAYTLDVTGTANVGALTATTGTFSGDVEITGETNVGALTATTGTFSGDVEITGDLDVSGNLGSSLVNLIYPVGAIYISVNSTNPGTIWSGTTWVSFGAGRTLVGLDTGDSDFNSSEETGGSKDVTLTTSQIPSHTHTYTDRYWTKHPYNLWSSAAPQNQIGIRYFISPNYTTGSTGGGESHTNLQPYVVTYMWKRTA